MHCRIFSSSPGLCPLDTSSTLVVTLKRIGALPNVPWEAKLSMVESYCKQHSHAPHNDLLVNNEPHIQPWSHKIVMEPKIPIVW